MKRSDTLKCHIAETRHLRSRFVTIYFLLMNSAIRMLLVASCVVLSSTSLCQMSGEHEAACYRSLSGFAKDPSTVTPPARPVSLAGVKLTYSESGCLGRCPSFKLTVTQSEAEFEGHAFVKAKGSRKAKTDGKLLQRFVSKWFDSKLYAMRDDYCSAVCPDGTAIIVTDVKESSINISTREFSKQVYECYLTVNEKPSRPKPPHEYYELRQELLAFVKSQGWL